MTVLSHDNYYRPYDELTIEERRKVNYDHPDAFDTEMMNEHLKQLKAGKPIQCPIYDYTTYSRSAETTLVEPRKVILVEGILIFENKALCEQMEQTSEKMPVVVIATVAGDIHDIGKNLVALEMIIDRIQRHIDHCEDV